MKVGEVCNREVVVAGKEITVQEAARLMRRHHVGDIVVVEEKNSGAPKPVGILTDRDIVVELLAQDVDVHLLSLGEVMTFELITAGEEDDVLATLKKMKNHGVRRIPVVEKGGGLAGILAVDDLIELIAEQLGDLIVLFRRQETREKEHRG
ncbi:MAG: CBS domain-containing protein [Deltaproteobacteria bacterium]|nr:CBS domain-containing protein [Deltaproteobacteria bacterium]